MFTTKKEKYLVIIIIVLITRLIHLEYSHHQLKERHQEFYDVVSDSMENDDTYQFEWESSIIQLLDNNKTAEARYQLYSSAIYKAREINLEEAEPDLVDTIDSFKRRFVEVATNQCNSGNLEACVQAGDQLERMEKFDAARDIYLKAANQGHLNAISSLAYLYRRKEWDNRSEAKSSEWFNKLD